jgi:Probable cobalt transporter subunit (CbtB)
MTEAKPLSPTRIDVRGLAVAAWLTGTIFLAVLVLYFVGLDQGATSIFGSDTHIHEFMHDARHLLGYPCH